MNRKQRRTEKSIVRRLAAKYAKKHEHVPDPKILDILEEYRHEMNDRAGKEIIFADSVEAAHMATLMILDGRGANCGLLMMLTQAGKTAVMLLIAAASGALLEYWTSTNRRVGINLIVNISQNSLKNQTIDRLDEAGFKKNFIQGASLYSFTHKFGGDTFESIVQVIMLSGSAKHELPKADERFKSLGVEAQMFMLDEGHVAIEWSQQLATYLRDHRNFIKSEKKLQHAPHNSVWSPETYVLAVTATGLDNYVVPYVEGETELFYTYYEPKSTTYYGPLHLDNDGRLIQWDKDEAEATDYEAILDGFSSTDTGYVLVRLPVSCRKQEEIAKTFNDYCAKPRNRKKGWVESEIFCQKEVGYAEQFDIDALDDKLATTLDLVNGKKQVVFIKQAAGAGDTFTTNANILTAFELRFTSQESMVHSIGRHCGHAPDRRNATYPIHCDREAYLEYINQVDLIKSGKYVSDVSRKRGRTVTKGEYEFVLLDKKGNIIQDNKVRAYQLECGDKSDYDDDWDLRFAHDQQLENIIKSGGVANRKNLIQKTGSNLLNIKEENIAAMLNGDKSMVWETRFVKIPQKTVPHGTKFASDKRKLIKRVPNAVGRGVYINPKFIDVRLVTNKRHGKKTPLNG